MCWLVKAVYWLSEGASSFSFSDPQFISVIIHSSSFIHLFTFTEPDILLGTGITKQEIMPDLKEHAVELLFLPLITFKNFKLLPSI